LTTKSGKDFVNWKVFSWFRNRWSQSADVASLGGPPTGKDRPPQYDDDISQEDIYANIIAKYA